MNQHHLEIFAKIPQPPRSSYGFMEDLKRPLEYHFLSGQGCDPGSTADCMKNGVAIQIEYPSTLDFPDTAFVSLRRVLKAKDIEENAEGYVLRFIRNAALSHEEFNLLVTTDGAEIAAADADGLRRAVYFLENRICEAEGASITEGEWKRKPFVKHRISRCFFGPTNRPPHCIDELTDDVDYYPDEYLNKLAHESINGLWLTMYFRDLPSSVLSGHGKDTEKRLEKLRKTVEKCGRYGIRIYIFVSEPKLFGNAFFAVPEKDSAEHPEVIGAHEGNFAFFCVSTQAGMKYLEESTEQIFKAVPQLGGMINIMMGEDNGSCVAHNLMRLSYHYAHNYCPRCNARDFAEIFRDMAVMFSQVIHKYNPSAEYIGWFYTPGQRDDSEFMRNLLHVAEKWPENAALMFNFESGGTAWQLGKKRIVFDYSLAYVGPSKLFAEASKKAPRTGAKLQVGCSHEDASIPFIPVPKNLYDKYKFMNEHGVSVVMQCWYFGNYPGLMNKAAGELSFSPFPKTSMEFLIALAKPDWRQDAPEVAEAWDCFSQAYRNFPANLSFAYYGPLHHCIVWPLHLFPTDTPIAKSWMLYQFPEVSGDRIGECLAYHHTLAEALQLCIAMSDMWQKGVSIMESLRSIYKKDPARQADIDLALAIGVQMKSACSLLHFYALREDMVYYRHDHLEQMKQIVLREISNTEKMLYLCERDSRLGYHSEAEGYLFFPEKLRMRIDLLHELLEEDFPRFRLDDPLLDEYTGKTPTGVSAALHRKNAATEEIQDMGNRTSWQGSYDDENLYLTIDGIKDKTFTISLEPCRLWPPYRLHFSSGNSCWSSSEFFPTEPEKQVVYEGENVRITIPRKLFDGFFRKGFPMRMNIWSPNDRFHWVEPQSWKPSYPACGFNPEGAGWLVFD